MVGKKKRKEGKIKNKVRVRVWRRKKEGKKGKKKRKYR